VIDNISVSLRAWRRGTDEPLPASAFEDRLSIAPGDPFRRAEGPGVARIQLVSLSFGDFVTQHEPSEAFAQALVAAFSSAAEWLSRQNPEVFSSLRSEGHGTDVIIRAWIDSDQIDLELPPEFSRECGRHGLPLTLITND
jgi:hypothetical protein